MAIHEIGHLNLGRCERTPIPSAGLNKPLSLTVGAGRVGFGALTPDLQATKQFDEFPGTIN